jgi:hypothetical protein
LFAVDTPDYYKGHTLGVRFIYIDLSAQGMKLYDLYLQLTSQTTVRLILKSSYQTLTTVLITLIVLMPPLPRSPEPPWQQETTGRNVIIQICMMTVLSSVITLKWSTVARNLNHKLLVSCFFIPHELSIMTRILNCWLISLLKLKLL